MKPRVHTIPEGGVGLGESEPSAEAAWGDIEIQRLPLDCIITFEQVRDEEDSLDVADLVDSFLKTRKLINHIDVARMDQDALRQYADFVNELWGTNHNVEDCPVGPDGKYYLCIAGHRRTKGLRQAVAADPSLPAAVKCKIHDTPTALEIVSIQLNENIYREPAKDRQLKIVAETYFFGLANGLWSNQAEFAKQNSERFGHNLVSRAVNYAKLPPEIRYFTEIAKDLHINAAVELGKMVDVLRIYFSRTILGNDKAYKHLTEAQHKSLIELSVLTWLGHRVIHIQNEGMKPLQATQHIRGYNKDYRRMNAARSQGLAFDLKLDGPERELQAIVAKMQREYEQMVFELGEQPLSNLSKAIRMHARILPQGEQIMFELGERIKSKLGSMGEQAVKAVSTGSVQPHLI
jgi:hypothetical protein